MSDSAEPGSRWDVLTKTGARTPMGELLRRYWWPIAGVSELEHNGTVPVRLMGEDLVLYKNLDGKYGLLDRRCRHRRADLSYGYVEKCGLRCNYHGWLYAANGSCLAQPYEDVAHPEARPRDQILIKAYPVEELGGLLWAYLGPEPRPLVPDWEFFSWKNGFRQIVKDEIPCNWFQCQENSIDPVHFEWTHSNWSVRLSGATVPYTPQHVKVDFSEFEYGFSIQTHPHRCQRQRPAVDGRPGLLVAELIVHWQSCRVPSARRPSRPPRCARRSWRRRVSPKRKLRPIRGASTRRRRRCVNLAATWRADLPASRLQLEVREEQQAAVS